MSVSDTSHRLGLPYLMASPAQKHVTHNETLRRIDVLVQLAALSRSLTVQPASPDGSATHILPEGASGDDCRHSPPHDCEFRGRCLGGISTPARLAMFCCQRELRCPL